MGILGFLHAFADYLLSLVKMVRIILLTRRHVADFVQVQNRQVGWKTIDRKACQLPLYILIQRRLTRIDWPRNPRTATALEKNKALRPLQPADRMDRYDTHYAPVYSQQEP